MTIPLVGRSSLVEIDAPLDTDEAVSHTPTQLAWRQLRKNRFAMAGGLILLLLYGMALFADFLAPYPYDRQQRELFYQPPTPITWRDAGGRFLWRPHAVARISPR